MSEQQPPSPPQLSDSSPDCSFTSDEGRGHEQHVPNPNEGSSSAMIIYQDRNGFLRVGTREEFLIHQGPSGSTGAGEVISKLNTSAAGEADSFRSMGVRDEDQIHRPASDSLLRHIGTGLDVVFNRVGSYNLGQDFRDGAQQSSPPIDGSRVRQPPAATDHGGAQLHARLYGAASVNKPAQPSTSYANNGREQGGGEEVLFKLLARNENLEDGAPEPSAGSECGDLQLSLATDSSDETTSPATDGDVQQHNATNIGEEDCDELRDSLTSSRSCKS